MHIASVKPRQPGWDLGGTMHFSVWIPNGEGIKCTYQSRAQADTIHMYEAQVLTSDTMHLPV